MGAKQLLGHWEANRAKTRKIGAAIPAGREGFRPAPETMALGEQILHVASAERTAREALTGRSAKWEFNLGVDLAHYPTIEQILAVLDQETQATRRYLAGLTDQDLAAKVDLPWGEEMTLGDLWYEWVFHEIHHRGSLVTGLRVAGVTPPSVW